MQPEKPGTTKSKKKSKADKRMTNRQTLLVKGMAAGKTITQAAIDAGYSPKNPGKSGWNSLETIREGFQEAATDLGVTPRTYMEKHVIPGMSASFVPRGTYLGGFFKAMELDPDDPEGKRLREVRDPDWAARLRFQTLFARLIGAMREEHKVQLGGGLTLDLNHVSDDELDRIIAELAKPQPPAKA